MSFVSINIDRYQNKSDFKLKNYLDYNEIIEIVKPYLKYQYIHFGSCSVNVKLEPNEFVLCTNSLMDDLKINDTLYRTYFRSNGPIIYFDEKSTSLQIKGITINLEIFLEKTYFDINEIYLQLNNDGKEENIKAGISYSPMKSIMDRGFYDKGCLYSKNKEIADKYYNTLLKNYQTKLPEVLAKLEPITIPLMHFKYFDGGPGISGNVTYFEALVYRTNGTFAKVSLNMELGNSDNYFVQINELYKKGSNTYYPKTYAFDEVPEEYKWIAAVIKDRHWVNLLNICGESTKRICSVCNEEIHGTYHSIGSDLVFCNKCDVHTVSLVNNQYEQSNSVYTSTKYVSSFQGYCGCGCGQPLLNKTIEGSSYKEFLGKKYRPECIDKIITSFRESIKKGDLNNEY